MKSTKRSLFTSIMALILCFSMLLGTTFAWFTDVVTSEGNKIVAGSLKIDLELYDKATGTWNSIKNSQSPIFNHKNWEPGYTDVKVLRITNKGSLALKWDASIIPLDELTALADVIDVYIYSADIEPSYTTRNNLEKNGFEKSGTLREFAEGLDTESASALMAGESDYLGIALKMRTEAGNEYKNLSCGEFDIRIVATQYSAESEKDSFDENYDSGAQFPVFKPADLTLSVKTENNKVTEKAYKKNGSASMSVLPGTKTTGTRLGLKVSEMAGTGSNLQLEENEILRPLDVHVDGVANDNIVPLVITLDEAMMKHLNIGNYKLYHVEDGMANLMTAVSSLDELDAHNEFYYDPATGNVSLAMATFSEVAMVAEKDSAWKGNRDYSWYTNAVAPTDSETVTEYTIANADQLAAFGAIVGGMDGQTQNSFAGTTVKLIADINLGDKETENNPNVIFYPIGYYNSDGTYERTNTAINSGLRNFEGTFDGNGHTISNFYHNTWEMKGDNNYYDATLQYYRDGMGLFGRVYGGTVKNLTVDNFSSDGEYTTTGVIAAYADGATFENISIINCNPRVYNIGNGGIVGCVGWYAKEADLKTTFTNITVDNSNKISALWGSYDVACGGIVGQYYPTSGQTSAGKPVNGGIEFKNCHISAQMDVYNDVCANYQYYAYRYTGMLIGSIRENVTVDGHVYPKMDGITASGCTVHFGTWNDYYYCEFEKNGHPSYSGPDDYKFSRIPHSEINFTDYNGNNIIDTDEERASVTGCKHNHTDAEDNQAVYLQFNNLVTGYGWGVTTKVVGELEGVTILDREVANSVEKFKGKVNELANNKTYKLGDIFNFVDNGVKLVPGALTVSVANKAESNPVSATIVYDRENWENGTITLTGTGEITITIQDYYFCTPTTITVNVTERQAAEKFESKFTGNFLYRVGNQNTVSLGSLFAAKDSVTDGKVSVTVEAVKGNASGTYTSNATWTNGTIQFSGTGVVKVTITDNDYCIPTVLYLEVVDATNLTSPSGYSENTNKNFVLLCDVNTSTYVNYWNCTLYGNGFTYSLKGAPTAYNSKQGHGILITQNTVFDNLVIVGDVYEGYGAYKDNDYYNTAIDIQGATTIQNCYISGCSAPIKVRSDVTIKDTTLYGGAVANLLIMSGTATLENVTTANYDDGRAMVGMGIVIHSDATETAKLVLNGTLTQYNFISESKVPTDTYAKNLHDAMFSSDCSQYQFGTSPNRYVNTGIISLTSTFNGEDKDITDNAKTGYVGTSVKLGNVTGYVYTQPKTNGTVNNNYNSTDDPHRSKVQGDYLPTTNFNLGDQAVTGEDRYIKGDGNGVEVRYIQGETPLTLDITKLMTVYKYEGANYAVSAVCKDSNGNVIVTNGVVTFSTEGSYTLVFTVEDNMFYNADGTKSDKSVARTYEVPLTVVIAEPDIADAVITVNKTALDGGYNESFGDRSYKFNPLGAITITDAEGTVDLKTNIASTNIVYASSSSAFAGATTITVTYNDGRVLKIVLGKPSLNSPGSSKAITYANDGTIKSSAKVASKSATGGTWTVTSYSFKGTNGKEVTNNTVVTFTFPDKSCVTGDTLVMLADGTEKRIDEVTYEDQLLVWNFFTGEYDVVPSAIIFYHGDAEYDILNLKFSDGTIVKVINNHGFYDVNDNNFVFIKQGNVEDYIGHSFVKVDGENYTSVELIGYEMTTEYTGCYSIQSALHNNFIVEGMFSLTIPHYDGWFDYFEIGEGMKYDEEKMQADIEKYGLYTYDDFAEYVTYEQFIAFNGPYLKVLVGRGVVTYEQIIELISMYVNPEQ